jgi:hypothetical protein
VTEPNTFELDGTVFKQQPLKLKTSLRAEAIIAEAVFPVFAAAAGGAPDGQALRMALAGLERIEELVDIFAASCEVQWSKGPGDPGTFVPLSKFLDLIFERRNALVLAWLAACIEWQFADFFAETGRNLLEQAASRFASLLG